MIIDVRRHGIVAVSIDDEGARLEPDDVVRISWPSSPMERHGKATRALVEILRRLGGHAARALVGGQFTCGTGKEVVLEVALSHASGLSRKCDSQLWSGNPFTVGLPEAFADAVLNGLTSSADTGLPSGTLAIDRAGFDEIESSAMAFSQAAAVLGLVLAAKVNDRDVEADVRALIGTW
jgi:hypothetical protein